MDTDFCSFMLRFFAVFIVSACLAWTALSAHASFQSIKDCRYVFMCCSVVPQDKDSPC